MAKKGLAKKMTFENRPEGVEGINNVEILGKRQSSQGVLSAKVKVGASLAMGTMVRR